MEVRYNVTTFYAKEYKFKKALKKFENKKIEIIESGFRDHGLNSGKYFITTKGV